MAKRGQNQGGAPRLRKDGRWECRVNLGIINGKRVRKSLFGKTSAECGEKLISALADQQKGLPIAIDKGNLGDHLDAWLERSVRQYADPATFDSYQQNVSLYLAPRDEHGRCLPLPSLGGLRLSKITPDHIRAWITSMRERTSERTNQPLSPRTTYLALMVLRTALNAAVSDGLVARNVARLVKGPRAAKGSKMAPLDAEQSKKFLSVLPGERLEAAYVVALRLGLRQAEVLGLRWGDVDFEGRTLKVEQTVKRVGRAEGKTELIFSAPKTESSRRLPSMSEPLIVALKAHRARQAEERLAAGTRWQANDLVFCTRVGGPIDAAVLWRTFKRLLVKAELPPIRFHDLRHSTASLLFKEGVPMKVISELLGHSSIRITADIYSHLTRGTMDETAATMDRILA
jgi:integrase